MNTTNETIVVRKKAGKPMSEKELQKLSAKTLIGRVTQFVRTDFGGEADKTEIALRRASKNDPRITSIMEKLTHEEQTIVGAALVFVAEDACEGSRKRLSTTKKEMIRRWVPKFQQ
jgi:predicted RND superfamily exporter protein